jgi:dynein heavy chain
LLTLAQHQIFSLVFERACSSIQVIRASLATLQKALKGLVVMSSDIETLAKNMFTSKMPVLWAPVSYPTMKPLSSYFNDLMDRLNMLQSWMDNGPSVKFWLSGFFFTHAFLTGVLQNFARKYRIPIDTICFEFICLPEQGDHEKRPEDGVYIYGMFLEGARWDNEHMMLAESFDKVTATIQHSQSALTQLANKILICRKI